MINNICHIYFTRPCIFFISLVLVFVSFTNTDANMFVSFSTTDDYIPYDINFTSVGGNVASGTCPDKERHALLHFKSYIHQDPLGLLSTWTEEEQATNNCCDWGGITCDSQIGHVTHVTSLDLSFGQLEGKICPSLLNLSYLNHLDLSGNYFNGTIPMFIGSMVQLKHLNLGLNDFAGNIPLELGNLTNLQELSLEHLFTIDNLDWLSQLSHLETLHMDDSSLAKVDKWVNVIISLKKLSTLRLDRCDLSYVMHPYSYSSINLSFPSSIVTLSLKENNLNSSMYHWLFPLTNNKLEELDVSGNNLDSIPRYLGNLCSLTSLDFSHNPMHVKFPNFLKNLSGCTSVTLQRLVASASQLTGSLSDDIQKFISLQSLQLSYNQLNGSISEKVWQLPKLQILDVASNLLKGAISENIGKTNISKLYLSNNLLEGVPSGVHMSNLSNVKEIHLNSCKLGPRFPRWIQTLKNISLIDLSNTGISDKVPDDFWNMWPSQLTYLNLSSNNITGIVTDLLSNFDPYFSTIDLSSNNFYGPITNVPPSLERLDLSRNKFYGEIFFLCQIVDGSLFFLDLSHNSFTGKIPDCLWHFKELTVLLLGHNSLSGRIPGSVKYLISLEVLYLYNNNFSGELSLSLQNCTKYAGNVGLCGLPLSKYCPGDREVEIPPVIDKSEDGDHKDDVQRWFYIGGATGFSIGFWMVCIALLVIRRGRHALFNFLDIMEDWVYVKVMVFIAKLRRVKHS
ncbi:hypothetical protein QVD17_30070 [Tagetes erecta]|uniref:Leucine-rich repeat-containing N-terminal plant-type domain-containing protein n=1 Tax=Tagetes erecta TaxID=13708 RepID=A0AAD8K4S8_TARER|nr:hypothetical protein QVD17_30070 [Tagetes erecta]